MSDSSLIGSMVDPDQLIEHDQRREGEQVVVQGERLPLQLEGEEPVGADLPERRLVPCETLQLKR